LAQSLRLLPIALAHQRLLLQLLQWLQPQHQLLKLQHQLPQHQYLKHQQHLLQQVREQ
jgi:hypothetical protein